VDLNHLLFEHQTSLMRAAAAPCDSVTTRHRSDAARHATQIGLLRTRLGAVTPMNLLHG
jgi:hypothetical protein